jgi:hypothetical protein
VRGLDRARDVAREARLAALEFHRGRLGSGRCQQRGQIARRQFQVHPLIQRSTQGQSRLGQRQVGIRDFDVARIASILPAQPTCHRNAAPTGRDREIRAGNGQLFLRLQIAVGRHRARNRGVIRQRFLPQRRHHCLQVESPQTASDRIARELFQRSIAAELSSESCYRQRLQIQTLRIQRDVGIEVDILQPLASGGEGHSPAFYVALREVLIVRLHPDTALRYHRSRRPRFQTKHAANLVQRERRLEVQRALPARIVQRPRGLNRGLAGAHTKIGNINAAAGDLRLPLHRHHRRQVLAAVQRHIDEFPYVRERHVPVEVRVDLRIFQILHTPRNPDVGRGRGNASILQSHARALQHNR